MRSRGKTSGRTCGELIALVAYYPRDDSVKGAWGCMTVPLGRWRHDNGCAEWALHMPSSEIGGRRGLLGCYALIEAPRRRGRGERRSPGLRRVLLRVGRG